MFKMDYIKDERFVLRSSKFMEDKENEFKMDCGCSLIKYGREISTSYGIRYNRIGISIEERNKIIKHIRDFKNISLLKQMEVKK
jgi:hypothetical protein